MILRLILPGMASSIVLTIENLYRSRKYAMIVIIDLFSFYIKVYTIGFNRIFNQIKNGSNDCGLREVKNAKMLC